VNYEFYLPVFMLLLGVNVRLQCFM